MTALNLPRTAHMGLSSDGILALTIIDQTKLPKRLIEKSMTSHLEVIDAIRRLEVRGAPVLGYSGAAALALWAVNESSEKTIDQFLEALTAVGKQISESRPTAVNLSVGVDLLREETFRLAEEDFTLDDIKKELPAFVEKLGKEDEAINRKIGQHGLEIIAPGSRILTHCNAGSLATVFFGTALGVIYTANSFNRIERIYIDETRPVGQGKRLTTWELSRVGIPATLLCDNMAASLMAQGKIDLVLVGADRISRNGDVANKIGTYGLAVLAAYHRIPFYVAAPLSTFDINTMQGSDIVIEQRDRSEITEYVLEGIEIYNPAFDITPHALITAYITEKGIVGPEDIGTLL